jgi:hypothetical protein
MNREEWWMDYLEDELEPEFKRELASLLARSSSDRKFLNDTAQVRQWIKQSDPISDLWDESRFVELAERITAALAKTSEKSLNRSLDSCSLPGSSNIEGRP